MDKHEWIPMVDQLNANYPGQELQPETGVQWFEALGSFPASEVAAAVDRVIREREWMPTGVAVILNAIDANWDEARAAERERRAVAARKQRNARGGAPPHPETDEVRELLERTKLPPYHPKHLPPAEGRRQIDAAVDRMDERLAREKREKREALFTPGGP